MQAFVPDGTPARVGLRRGDVTRPAAASRRRLQDQEASRRRSASCRPLFSIFAVSMALEYDIRPTAERSFQHHPLSAPRSRHTSTQLQVNGQ